MKYSIILPIYNVEKYLSACIESILSQTYKDYEIILVDDGSKDSSGKICNEYADKYDFVKVIHKTNGGLSDARNVGLKQATGEYVFFIDSDDYLIDNRVLERFEKATQSNPDVVAFGSIKWFESTNSLGSYSGNLQVCTQSKVPSEIYCELIDRDAYSNSAWSKIIKRSLLVDNNIKFEKGLLGEDNDWYYKVVSHIGSLELMNEPLYVYRQREGSITHTYTNKNIEHLLWLIERWSTFVFEGDLTGNKTVIRNSLAKQYCHALIGYASLEKTAEYEKRLKGLNYLLQYSNNPRVKKFRLLNKTVGMKGTIALLRIVRKIKK